MNPHSVTAAEVVPGDLVALSREDAAADRWYVVTHTLPESPEVIRVTLRPPLGGTDRDELLRREQRVTVAGRRLDVAAVPVVSSPTLDDVEFRDGDRVTTLRAVDPAAEDVRYVRRWGAWYRDADDDGTGVADADVRRWAAEADREGQVVRHEPRPVSEARAAGARRVVATGLGAVTPLGAGTSELWQGLLEGRHGIRELDGEEFDGL
ncbi:3-oxoacyl-ACP synthase, partial [Streptomyces sp. 15-116A]|uniref:beta-ketoacyl synthase N-terminal-like domain-containing protein n=1 Tax=Streptomyces sp. 15-116A TaxID=2259035 RepID=UPI0028C47D8A